MLEFLNNLIFEIRIILEMLIMKKAVSLRWDAAFPALGFIIEYAV